MKKRRGRQPEHGESKRGAETVEYRLWKRIKARCYNENVWNYNKYGGRGISMNEAWKNQYSVFLKYLLRTIGRRPSDLHSIDRINTDGNYEPGNIKWSTRKEQNNNQRHGNRYVRHYST